jgi:hypothetical protein
MPRLKNKNTNKNKNNIRITINNSSSSKRRRKSSGKAKQSNSIPINPMPTIIQMHHHNSQPPLAQIADNNYGVGMAEKIDALAGGLTRVFEKIEIKQQENYTRDKNETFLQTQLKNRENELKVLSAQRNPTVGNNAQPLQTPKVALNMDQSQSSSQIGSSVSGSFDGTIGSGQFGHKVDDETFLDSVHTPQPISAMQLIQSPTHNIDSIYNDGHIANESKKNPMYSNPEKLQNFANKYIRKNKYEHQQNVLEEHQKDENKKMRQKMATEKYKQKKQQQDQNPEGPQLIRPYRRGQKEKEKEKRGGSG